LFRHYIENNTKTISGIHQMGKVLNGEEKQIIFLQVNYVIFPDTNLIIHILEKVQAVQICS